MRKFDVNKWRKAVEAEFNEPLRDVVAGFVVMKTPARTVADALECPPDVLSRFAKKQGLHLHGLHRVRRGSKHRRMISEAMSRWHRTEGRGQFKEISELTGLPKSTISSRLKKGVPKHKLAAAPKPQGGRFTRKAP